MSHSLPIPLDDELALGFLGRYARLNGMSSISWAQKSLRAAFREGKNFPVLWMIAKACDLDPLGFTAKHSMIPVLYPISRYGGTAKELSSRRYLASAYGLSASATGIRWCPECAHLEQHERGFGHWKRAHQINGIDWCVTHLIPLISESLDAAIFAPADAPSEAQRKLSQVDLEEELNNPALQRLQYILLEWLQLPKPIHLRAWSAVVSQRCREQQLRISEIGKRSIVSDLILEQFPKAWMNRHMPDVAEKQARSCVRKVDGACADKHVTYPALVCGAVLSVLFENAEEALAELELAERQLALNLTQAEATQCALDAFLRGSKLTKACQRFGASLESVAAELKQGYLLQKSIADAH